MCDKRGLWAIKAKNGGASPHHDPKTAVDKPTEKPPRFYSADDVKKPLLNKRKPIPTRLRKCLLLKLVLCMRMYLDLNELISYDLILNVMANKLRPFNTNGVPPRRVDQSYVIATSPRLISLGSMWRSLMITTLLRKWKKRKRRKRGNFLTKMEGSLINCLKIAVVSRNCVNRIPLSSVKNKFPSDKKEDQKAVDSPLMKAIEGVPFDEGH
ncbi:hypothetical protein DKX38_009162 [Salix brachista]|uniref:Uncharacterized protein n=1 Tax=Salix brachista TaxID=2182728 RepID=A0A5N5MC76_9ROSI|nr:hypothetical protein DKX38_009162 [Salix brachista]